MQEGLISIPCKFEGKPGNYLAKIWQNRDWGGYRGARRLATIPNWRRCISIACINSVVFPIVSKLPQEAQEVYNAVYHSKGILDSLINAATDDLLSNILAQVVRSEISKYDVRDIAENVVDYETSMGLSPQSNH